MKHLGILNIISGKIWASDNRLKNEMRSGFVLPQFQTVIHSGLLGP